MTPESIRPGIPSVNESISTIERMQFLELMHDETLKEIERLQTALRKILNLSQQTCVTFENQMLETVEIARGALVETHNP